VITRGGQPGGYPPKEKDRSAQSATELVDLRVPSQRTQPNRPRAYSI
jgi:hypothetical protein